MILKASEGRGDKGIRKCSNGAELKTTWEQVTTEVAGSPIFVMQLCTGARHLEVQFVGDEHGDVIALNGWDCSTQRRFQKIFEEGPPSIAAKDDFERPSKLRRGSRGRFATVAQVRLNICINLSLRPSTSVSSTHVCRCSTLWPRASLA